MLDRAGLDDARAALDGGDFRGALLALEALPDDPAVLELRGAAAYGAGELEVAVGAWERLYAAHAAAGRDVEAGFAAALVALNLLCETGLMAPVRGWLGRARQHVSGRGPGPIHALLAIVETYERFLSGDPGAALGPAREAVALGAEFGVDPARGLGRVALARIAIGAGEVEAGLEQLDELALALGAGEFDPLTTGNVYCELICAAHWIGRLDRAREWTDLMERWRHGRAYGAPHGRCRVHRAELLRVSGPAAEAEAEALAACSELRPWMRREFGWPLVELGTIRLRRGDLAGAEEAFLDAHERSWCAQPGLALLRLAAGEADEAAVMVRAEIEHPTELPWKERPPFGELRLLPLLEALSEIAEVRRDRAGAAEAAAGLAAIHEHYPSDGLRASVRLAQARVALLEGRPAEAIGPAREAVALWVDLAAPYDAGVARLLVGDAHLAAGDPATARREWEAARAAFVRFGAELRVLAADERLGPAARESAAPTAADGVTVVELLWRGDHRVLRHAGTEVVLADLKGLRYLVRMLAEPGREFDVLDLAGAEHVAAALPVLDEQAKAAYRRRLTEVEADIAEAEADNDVARLRLAQRDRDYLLAELSRAVGLGGRSRTTGGTVERARTSVTRSVRYAVERIGRAAPDIGAHLAVTVRTGVFCCYRPDPVARIEWRIDEGS